MSLPCCIRTSIITEEMLEPCDSAHPIFVPTGQRRRQRSNHWSTSDISSSAAAENRDTYSAQTFWLSRLPCLKNAVLNAIMSAENEVLLQLQFQDNDKSLNKDSIIIRSHSNQVGWKPGFTQQVVQGPLWQLEESSTHPHMLLAMSAWTGWAAKQEGKRISVGDLIHYLHVCEDAGDFAGPGSCFLVVGKGLHLSPWKSSRLGWKTNDRGSQLKGNISKMRAQVCMAREGRASSH